jgi:hypothetical protein
VALQAVIMLDNAALQAQLNMYYSTKAQKSRAFLTLSFLTLCGTVGSTTEQQHQQPWHVTHSVL